MSVTSPRGTGVPHAHVAVPDVTVPHVASAPQCRSGGPPTGPGTGREIAGVKESWGRA